MVFTKKLKTLLVKLLIENIKEDKQSLRENFHENHNTLAKIFYKVLTNFGLILLFKTFWYKGSPIYTKITNRVSTTTVFGLCMCKWGIFALVGDSTAVPLTRISCNTVSSKSQYACKVGTLCIYRLVSTIRKMLS